MKPTSDSDDVKARRGKRVSFYLVTIFSLLVLYALSAGPAGAIYVNSGPSVQRAIEAFYWPLR
jgi:hypothetical protein